jgi:hypothetical protein
MNKEKAMTNRIGFRGILLAAGVSLILGACSGSPAAPTAPAAPGAGAGAGASAPIAQDPPAASAAAGGGGDQASPACALVTNDEVATAVGYSIATVNGAGGTCIYQNTDPSQYFAVQLFDSQDAMSLYLSVEDTAQHVSGLGDDAFWSGTAGFLFVRSGTRAVLFLNQAWVFTPDTDTAHRDSLVTLARAALPNL